MWITHVIKAHYAVDEGVTVTSGVTVTFWFSHQEGDSHCFSFCFGAPALGAPRAGAPRARGAETKVTEESDSHPESALFLPTPVQLHKPALKTILLIKAQDTMNI